MVWRSGLDRSVSEFWERSLQLEDGTGVRQTVADVEWCVGRVILFRETGDQREVEGGGGRRGQWWRGGGGVGETYSQGQAVIFDFLQFGSK